MRDGFTTGSGLGLGLGGAKRLVNEFEIDSAPGAGTRVVITRWL
jgi:serine/threonine-protein kinase RsbT